jgi:hypothetical protein
LTAGSTSAAPLSATVTDNNATNPYLSLSVGPSVNCPNYSTIGGLNLGIERNSMGSGWLSVDCATVTVGTTYIDSYSLYVHTDTPDLNHTTITGQKLTAATGTITAPAALAAGEWGFALPSNLVSVTNGFDASYVRQNSTIVNPATNSKFAGVPNTPTLVKTESNILFNQTVDTTDFYFAAAVDLAQESGDYTGEVTFTVHSDNVHSPDQTTDIVVNKDDAMIPVAYVGSATSPQWVVADTTNSNIPNIINSNGGNYDWYNYSDKKWANAVTVTTANRATYQSAAAGTPIDVADVLSYYVYIPRFRYAVWTLGWSASNYPKAINIELEDCNSNGTFCQTAGYTKGTTDKVVAKGVGVWLTHPAFTFDGKELNGFWVGKYESTNSAATPRSLPDATQATNSNINTMFNGARSVVGGEQGLNATQSDVRILNDDQWGAVAYLSQSLYGVCTNAACTEDGTPATSMTPDNRQKVWNNVTATCGITGYSGRTGYGAGGKADTCIGNTYNADNLWHTDNGVLASTTHNPTGVYDMAAGVWEYTLGNYNNTAGSSGLTMANITKYLNVYPNPPLTNSANDLYLGKYDFTPTATFSIGRSLFETGGSASTNGRWHSDRASSVSSGSAWQARGGHSNSESNAGIFAAESSSGGAVSWLGSRLIQTIP